MDNQMKDKFGTILTGTLVAGALIGTANTATASLFQYEDLGSGSELRADLLNTIPTGFMSTEAKCGEGKCGEEGKTKEHKCGEGKCGDSKEASTDDAVKSESKATEHKCGEGKCGGEAKEDASKEKAKTTTENPK